MSRVKTERKELLELDAFISDDKRHHVAWIKPPKFDYEIWYCKDHKQAYFTYCLMGKELEEQAYNAQNS